MDGPWPWDAGATRLELERLSEAETAVFLGALRANKLPPGLQSLAVRMCRHLAEWPRDARLPPSLRDLEVSSCKLTALPDLRGAPALETVSLWDNYIGEALPAEQWLPGGVATVNLSYNRIYRVEDWDACFPPGVVSVDVSFNHLSAPPPPGWAARVQYHHNDMDVGRFCASALAPSPLGGPAGAAPRAPMELLYPTLGAPLDEAWPHEAQAARADPAHRAQAQAPRGGVYTNRQSVHDTTVQAGAHDAILAVMDMAREAGIATGEPGAAEAARLAAEVESALYDAGRPLLHRILRRILFLGSGAPPLLDWCLDRCVHSRTGVTYARLLRAVWAVASTHAHGAAIRARLREEIDESAGMCFTGRLTRLVNALAGLVDGVRIGVSAREQLRARVDAITGRLDREPARAAALRRELEAALDDAGAELMPGEREAWLEAFDGRVG